MQAFSLSHWSVTISLSKESFQEASWLWKALGGSGKASCELDPNIWAGSGEGVPTLRRSFPVASRPLFPFGFFTSLPSSPTTQRGDASSPHWSPHWSSVSSTRKARDRFLGSKLSSQFSRSVTSVGWLQWEGQGGESQGSGAENLCFPRGNRGFFPAVIKNTPESFVCLPGGQKWH